MDSSPHCAGWALIALTVQKKAIYLFVSASERKQACKVPVFGCTMVSGRKIVVNVGFRSQRSSDVYFSEGTVKLCVHMYMDMLFCLG